MTIEESPNTKVIAISQNEEGVIYSNSEYDGLVTHGIQTCVAVIIIDRENQVYIMQHHDPFTNASSIKKSIVRESLTRPEIYLVINPCIRVAGVERILNVERIKSFLEKENIGINKILETNPYNSEGGVLLFKYGEIIVDYGLINIHMNPTPFLHREPEFILFKELRCQFTSTSERFVPSKMKFKSLDNVYLIRNIENTNIFAERRDPFLRYDGHVFNTSLNTLQPKMEHYLRTLFEEGIRGFDELNKRICNDRLKGIFDVEGDRHRFESERFVILLERYTFRNLTKILRFGCLPPPGFYIKDGKTHRVE